jgi:hypothetical protein
MPLVFGQVRAACLVAAVSALRARSDLHSAVRSLGNDGALTNVRTHLAATAEARAAVDRMAWRVAAADRAAAAARATAPDPVTLDAA